MAAVCNMDDLSKKHAQEERFTLGRIAQLAKPKLGQKPLSKEALEAQSSKLLSDLRVKHEAEVAALAETLSKVKVSTDTAQANVDNTAQPPIAHVQSDDVKTTSDGVGPSAPIVAAAAPAPLADSSSSRTASEKPSGSPIPAAETGNGGGGKKLSRAQRRKDKKAAARAGDSDDEDAAPSGPDPKEVEITAIMTQLTPKGLDIKHVAADGNCLFRAVSDQLLLLSDAMSRSIAAGGASKVSVPDHVTLRKRAAEHIRAHADAFAPFLPYEESDGYPEGADPEASAVQRAVDRYCARMAGSSAWGGHPELRALSCTLGLPLVVYQAGAPAFTITPERESVERVAEGARRRAGGGDDSEQLGGLDALGSGSSLFNDPNLRLQLSFHRSYYTLGEHYNSVVAKGAAAS